MQGTPPHGDTTRVEAFSDAVFGFAITLLVVSLEVPRTFDEMAMAMRMLPAFAASFALLLLIWQEHRAFFKRFGVDDGVLLWLNGALLFVVLAYVYPLKFLMNMLLGPGGVFFGGVPPGLHESQVPTLMAMYGCGFITLFVVLAAMHGRALAWHRRTGADRVLLREIRLHRGGMLVYAAVGVASVAVALLSDHWAAMAVSGGVYGLTGPAHVVYHSIATKRMKREA